jgi:signal transduction histidine kinase
VSARALRQSLDVLIDNALTHGEGTITLATRARPGGVEISVTDEGTADLQSDAIFERRSASVHGQGIGLALARSLTEAERGRLHLLAGEPTTTFSLFFLTDDEV